MKKMKWLALVFAFLLAALCLTGCGATATDKMENAVGGYYDRYDSAVTEPMSPEMDFVYDDMDYGLNYDAEMEVTEESTTTAGTDTVPEGQNTSLKMVYTVDLYVETLEYEKSIEVLEQLTQEFGGYVEYAQVESDRITSQYLRSAYYTIRVPAQKLDAFLESCGDVGNICNNTRRSENLTTEYVDLEARLRTLLAEEESLLELLEQAQDLDTVVALHGYLSDVRYEIERTESRMRGIDGLVSYSTVNLNLDEVKVQSNVVTPKSTFGERLRNRAHNSWIDFSQGMENFGVFALGQLPLILLTIILVLLPFGIIALVIVLLIRRGRRRRRARREAEALQAQNAAENDSDTQPPLE